MTPHEQALLEAFPWLTAFRAGWVANPSADTLAAARVDFLDVFFNGGSRQVEAFLTWLKPERMTPAAFGCLLEAADVAGVKLPRSLLKVGLPTRS